MAARDYKARHLLLVVLAMLIANSQLTLGLQQSDRHHHHHSRGQTSIRNRLSKEPPILRDTFYEDNTFVVRIKTNFGNGTGSMPPAATTCNAVMMSEDLVLSDVTCIKYQQMANIDAKFVRVIVGETGNETEIEVDQIYVNKADPKDPGTELALLRLNRKLQADSQCKTLILPEKGQNIESDTPVRVVGYTIQGQELKENRSRISKRNPAGDANYIYTTAVDKQDKSSPPVTPGGLLLRGAPLLRMIDCKQYQLIGVLSRTEPIIDGVRKEQDTFVKVASIMRWYNQVRIMSSLNAKNGPASSPAEPSVIVVTVEPDH